LPESVIQPVDIIELIVARVVLIFEVARITAASVSGLGVGETVRLSSLSILEWAHSTNWLVIGSVGGEALNVRGDAQAEYSIDKGLHIVSPAQPPTMSAVNIECASWASILQSLNCVRNAFFVSVDGGGVAAVRISLVGSKIGK